MGGAGEGGGEDKGKLFIGTAGYDDSEITKNECDGRVGSLEHSKLILSMRST